MTSFAANTIYTATHTQTHTKIRVFTFFAYLRAHLKYFLIHYIYLPFRSLLLNKILSNQRNLTEC